MNTALTLARQALAKAYCPYSQFQVGCCIRSTAGNYYSGANIENASYGLTLCAESSAIAAMRMAGDTQIAEVTLISSGKSFCSPCGACRQRIGEFATPDVAIHMYSNDGHLTTCTLHTLLPHAFGPQHLTLELTENA